MVNSKQWLRDVFGDRRVRRIKAIRTRVACKYDVGPWRRLGFDGIDLRLADNMGWIRDGTFIELGGNDGLQFSNSFMFERELGWTGVLIEGIPELAAEAVRNRPKAVVVCAAVTNSVGIVPMDENDRVSKISTTGGRQWVATTTLSQVIDSLMDGRAPDLLSVDVEGHELEVLEGLNLSAHAPRWILVESKRRDAVDTILGERYRLVERLSHQDFLYASSPDICTK